MNGATRPVVIIGAASVAVDVLDVIASLGRTVSHLVDETANDPYEVLGHRVEVSVDPNQDWAGVDFHVAIGDNAVRERVVRRLERSLPQINWVTLIHPGASISPTATVGAGALVMAGTRVAGRARVGRFAQLNMNVVVSHDCSVGEFASLNSGCALGGRVRVGDRTNLGLNSSVREKTDLGADVIVGAGSFVNRDVPGRVIVVGLPARVLRTREPGERYLR